MKKKELLISIIIPVYNIEKYIGQCLQTIITQTYKNIEIIVVNDGSKDNSKRIVEEYVNKDKRIKLFTKENGGLSDARNFGIKLATGNYIMFVDGDDFLYNSDAIEKIANHLFKENYEVMLYNFVEYYQSQRKYRKCKSYFVESFKYTDKHELFNELIKNGTFSIAAWNKIVKREFLEKNNISFKDKILSEDIDFSFKLYLSANQIGILDEYIYTYRKDRPGSITNNTSADRISSLVEIIIFWANFDYREDKKIKYLYLSYLAYQYNILLALYNYKNTSKKTRKEIKSYKWLLDYDLNFKVKKTKKVYKIFKYNTTRMILKIYRILREKTIVNI